jgi:hypothetical protein
MIKPAKFFRKQAEKADQAAARIGDDEASGSLRALANAYRSQADAIKRNKQKSKNKKLRKSV